MAASSRCLPAGGLACSWRRWGLACAVLALACWWFAGAARADEITRRVQEELRKRNLYFGDVDGRRNLGVAAALRRYQQRKGFTATGQFDDDTLRSLLDEETLRAYHPEPTAPSTAPVAVAGMAPPVEGLPPAGDGGSGSVVITPEPWPDVPVLRSDLGRRSPQLRLAAANLAQETAATPTPRPPSPPPAAARRAESPALRDFVDRYLRAGQNNDADTEMRFYGDQVEYFNEGTVDRRFIRQDVRRYQKRWPRREFALLGPVLSEEDPNTPGQRTIRFRYRFTNRGKFRATGVTDNTWTVAGDGPENFRITAMKEQRVLKP